MKMRIGTYLFEVLKKYGIHHVFGVPGDYNLGLLDRIDDVDDIQWVGDCNELNASYAADGYSRKNGMGVLITTNGDTHAGISRPRPLTLG